MLPLMPQAVIQGGALPGCFCLRVRWLIRPLRAGKLGSTPVADHLDQLRIRMADEIRKRRGFPVFFTHEQQGYERRQEHHRRGQLQPFEGDQAAEPIAFETVSHLIVVLGADHEPARGQVFGGIPVSTTARRGIGS